MIDITIKCDGESCKDAGHYYSGYNPLQGTIMKKELQLAGWSFRGPIDTDEGEILCPVCFRKKAMGELQNG